MENSSAHCAALEFHATSDSRLSNTAQLQSTGSVSVLINIVQVRVPRLEKIQKRRTSKRSCPKRRKILRRNLLKHCYRQIFHLRKIRNPLILPYIKKRLEKNKDLEAIISMTRNDVNPGIYAALQECQPTSASVERSFSMLGKLLAKDRNFLPDNIGKYLLLQYNNK